MNIPIISTSKANVLVIDDEVTLGMGIVDFLAEENIKATHVISAEAGLKFLEEHPEIDIILLDINLGSGLNGVEALKIIKGKNKYIQVVMMSSMDTLEIAVECMKKGAFDYMTKPLDDDRFIDKIPVMMEKKKLEQLSDIYLGIIVHDLRNPLSNIKLSVDYLSHAVNKSAEKEDKLNNFFAIAIHGIKQIEMMVSNIINVTKFEKGFNKANPEKFILKDLAEECLQIFTERKVLSRIHLEIKYQTKEGYVLNNDREFFTQVLWNIVSNAFRFSKPDENIILTFSELADHYLGVSVTNKGSYIEQGEREKIFDKFSDVRYDESKSSSKNFGLGLTYSKMAVEIMGGKIRVESNKENRETTFIYTVKNF